MSAKNMREKEPLMRSEASIVDLGMKWANASTIHAVRNIVETKYIIVRIMWILCLLISASYCTYTVVQSFMSFLDYDVLTSSQIVQEANSPFPAVTFCYIDWCDPNFIEKLKGKEDGFIGLEPPELYAADQNSKYGYLISKEALINSISNSRKPKNLTQILVSCYFNGNECYESDFFAFETDKAMCYTFNSAKVYDSSRKKWVMDPDKTKSSTKFGKKYGLQLEFYAGLPSDMCTFKSTSGITLYVHNQSQTVTSEDEGIEIGVGYETNIAVERTFIIKFSTRNSFCVSELRNPDAYDSRLFKQTVSKNDIYNQKFCFQLRCQQEILETCKCSDPWGSTNPSTNYTSSANATAVSSDNQGEQMCSRDTVTQYTCPNLIKEAFYSNDYFNKYASECPKECESILYRQSVSTVEFPSVYYAQFLSSNQKIKKLFGYEQEVTTGNTRRRDNKRLDLITLRKSLLAANIYYNSDSFQQITEKLQKTFDNLLSDFGGQTGLFLGMSLLSIFEIFELFIEMIFLCWEKRKRRMSIKQHSASLRIQVKPSERRRPAPTQIVSHS